MKSLKQKGLFFLVGLISVQLSNLPLVFAQAPLLTQWVKSIEQQEVLFDLGQTHVNEDGRVVLNDIASKISQIYGDFVIEVIGHTDDIGDSDINLKVSQQRAMEVARYLSDQNLHHHRFLIDAKGKFQPKVSNITEQGRAQNRRVEFKIQPQGKITLLNDPSQDLDRQAFAQAPSQEEEVILHDGIEEIVVEEQNLDQENETASESPVDQAQTPDTEKPTQDQSIAPASTQKKGKASLKPLQTIVEEKEQKWSSHPYDLRKKPVEGTVYGWVGPMWTGLQDLQDLGQTANSKTSKTSLTSGLGWTTFLEDDAENVFINMEGFANYERFDQDGSAGFAEDENQWTYGGNLRLGVYPIRNLSLSMRAGFSLEPYLKTTQAGGINYTADFIGSLGADLEAVVYRFRQGNVGVKAHFTYFDIGLSDLETGYRFGGGLFADYDLFRLSLAFSKTQLEALGVDTSYNRFSILASFYY